MTDFNPEQVLRVLILEHGDTRVETALARENGYWQSAWSRKHEIEQRCHDAGYPTSVSF